MINNKDAKKQTNIAKKKGDKSNNSIRSKNKQKVGIKSNKDLMFDDDFNKNTKKKA